MNGLPMAPTEPLAIESILQVLSQYVRVGSGEAFTAARFALQSLQTLQSIDQVFKIVRDAYEKAKTTKVDPQMLERHRAVLETLQAQASFLQAQQMQQQQQKQQSGQPQSAQVETSSTKSVLVQPGNVNVTRQTEMIATAQPLDSKQIPQQQEQQSPQQQKQQQQQTPVSLQMPSQPALSVDEQRRMRYLRIQDSSGNVVVALLTAVDSNDMTGAAALIQGVSDKETLNRAFEASVLAFQTEKVAAKQQAHTQVQELLRQRFRQLEAATASSTVPSASTVSTPASTTTVIRVPSAVKTPTTNSGPLPCWMYLLIGLVIIALIAGIVALIRGSGKKKKATTTMVTTTETVGSIPPSVKSRSSVPPMSPPSRSQEDALLEQQRRIRELQRQLDDQSRQVERMRQVQRLEQMAVRPSPFAAEERNTELSLAEQAALTDSEVASGF